MTSNLDKYQGRRLTKGEIREVVSYLYTDFRVNQTIFNILSEQDAVFVSSCLDEVFHESDLDAQCDIAYLMACLGLAVAKRCNDMLLLDQDENVRCTACRNLPIIGGRDSLASLVRLLQSDPSGSVRYLAVDGIGAIGDTSTVHALQVAANSDTGCDYEGNRVHDNALKVLDKLFSKRSPGIA